MKGWTVMESPLCVPPKWVELGDEFWEKSSSNCNFFTMSSDAQQKQSLLWCWVTVGTRERAEFTIFISRILINLSRILWSLWQFLCQWFIQCCRPMEYLHSSVWRADGSSIFFVRGHLPLWLEKKIAKNSHTQFFLTKIPMDDQLIRVYSHWHCDCQHVNANGNGRWKLKLWNKLY